MVRFLVCLQAVRPSPLMRTVIGHECCAVELGCSILRVHGLWWHGRAFGEGELDGDVARRNWERCIEI